MSGEGRALPLFEIVDVLGADAELAAVIVSEAAVTLHTTDPADLALMKSLHLLRDRLATRAHELRATTDAIEADLSLARLGLLP